MSTETLKVSFSKGMPMGTMATFTHDDELWIAYPSTKNQAIYSLVTKLTAAHARIGREIISWINQRPTDIELVAKALEMASEAQKISAEFIDEKNGAFTS